MDLKAYYRRVREVEATLPEGDILVVSLKTGDGGKEGVRTELGRFEAARAVVEAWARLATEDETREWKDAQRASLEAQRENELKSQVRFRVLSDEEMRALRSAEPARKKGDKGGN